MMVEAAKDALTEYSYAASVAGLHYQIMESIYGYEVRLIFFGTDNNFTAAQSDTVGGV